MANNCWYCRKGGLVDLYFAGRTGVCPGCGRGVNIVFDAERFMTLDAILTGVEEWAKSVGTGGTGGSEPNEPLTMAQLEALPNGTNVYCYRIENGKLVPDENEVCRTKQGNKLTRKDGWLFLSSVGIDSDSNNSDRRAYLKEVDLSGGNSGSQREYKVGDRVVIEKSNIDGMDNHQGGKWNFAGKTGEIIDIMGKGEFKYFVRLDEGGYNLYCSIKCLVEEDCEREEIPF